MTQVRLNVKFSLICSSNCAHFPPSNIYRAVNAIKGAVDAGKRTRRAIKQELKHAVGEAIRTGEGTTEKLEHIGDDMVDAAKRKLARRGDDMVDAANRTRQAIKQAIRTGVVATEKSAHGDEDMINSAVSATSDTTERISHLKGRIKKPFREMKQMLKSSPSVDVILSRHTISLCVGHPEGKLNQKTAPVIAACPLTIIETKAKS